MNFSGIDVEDLVARLGLQNARLASGGMEINFSCYGDHIHGDERPSAYINVETTLFMCHGCHRTGNAVTLVMDVQQVNKPTAESQLREWYGIEFIEPEGGSMIAEIDARFRAVEEESALIPPPSSWLSSARVDWRHVEMPWEQYMLARGFTPETLIEWDIGYDYVSDRITIPVFDIDGGLVGIKARDWTGEQQPKYRILGDSARSARWGFTPYEAGEVVFGLHRNRGHRQGVILEGELNALALSQLGVPRPIATGMSYMTERHVQLIARELDEVIIFYDYGPAGHEGVWGRYDGAGRFRPGAAMLLEPFVRVRVVEPLPEDPAKLLEFGRGTEALGLIEAAKSSLDLSFAFG